GCARERPRSGQSLGLLSGMGVRRRRTLSARASLCEEILAVLLDPVPLWRVSLLLLRTACHPQLFASVQRLARRRTDLASERVDGLRDNPAARLRCCLSDAAHHAFPGADQYPHRG